MIDETGIKSLAAYDFQKTHTYNDLSLLSYYDINDCNLIYHTTRLDKSRTSFSILICMCTHQAIPDNFNRNKRQRESKVIVSLIDF